MTRPVTGLIIFENNSSNSLVNLDYNFSLLANAINDPGSSSNYGVDSGTTNTVIVTISGLGLSSYSDGQTYAVKIANNNTAAATLNINALGTKNIYDMQGNAVAAGMLVAGQICNFIYNSTLNAGSGGFNLYTPNYYGFVGGQVLLGTETVPYALPFNTNLVIDAYQSNVFEVGVLTANFTLSLINSAPVGGLAISNGQTILVWLVQDATGGRVATWTGIKWPGGSAQTLSTSANAIDLLTLTYRNSTGFWYGNVMKNFS